MTSPLIGIAHGESRVAVLASGALTHRRAGDDQLGMQLGAPRVAHAVHRPHAAILLEVGRVGWMPVLGVQHGRAGPASGGDLGIARIDHLGGAGHRERAGGIGEVVLHVDDDECRGRAVGVGHHRPRYRLGRGAGRRSSRARQHHTIGGVRGVLSTDQYQLTMVQLYFRAGLHERPVRFEHFFRTYPDYGDHQAGYCIAAGLAPFVEWTDRRACHRRRHRHVARSSEQHRRPAVRRRLPDVVRPLRVR